MTFPKVMYLAMNLTTENDYTVGPFPITFGEGGLIGMLPVYESAAAAVKAWPRGKILAITLQRRAEPAEVAL